MRNHSVSIVSKAILSLLVFSLLCVIGQAANATSAAVPLKRRPTPTLPPVQTQVVGDALFAQIENEIRFQMDDVARVEVAAAAGLLLDQIGESLTTGQLDHLLALASSDEARNAMLNQLGPQEL